MVGEEGGKPEPSRNAESDAQVVADDEALPEGAECPNATHAPGPCGERDKSLASELPDEREGHESEEGEDAEHRPVGTGPAHARAFNGPEDAEAREEKVLRPRIGREWRLSPR